MRKIAFLVIGCISFSFAMIDAQALNTAQISFDTDKIDINDTLQLKISINTNGENDIQIQDIPGMENFHVIGQSQSQSSSTQVRDINGVREIQSSVNHLLILKLSPKEKGKYTIGPIQIYEGTGSILSNSVNIEVTGDKQPINTPVIPYQNSPAPPQNTPPTHIQNSTPPEIQPIEDFTQGVEKKDFKNYTPYIIIVLLVTSSLLLYFILKQNTPTLEKIGKNTKEIPGENHEKEVSFENISSDISYPDITENDFIVKIYDIFQKKLQNKFHVPEISKKTFDEILLFIPQEEKEKITQISNLLLRAKYSNMIQNHEKILYLIKNI